MMAFASRTGTRTTIAAMKAAGWGWMVGPLDMGGEVREGMPHALDNGAWPAFNQGVEWDEDAFVTALVRYGPTAVFVVCPDIVADRVASLKRTALWLPRLLARSDLQNTRILIAVQDDMTQEDIDPFLTEPRIGIFIGGSTEWKESAIIPWGSWAKSRGLYVHVGRVNTRRRLNLCLAAGVDSFDGTSVTRFPKTLQMLDQARCQSDFQIDSSCGDETARVLRSRRGSRGFRGPLEQPAQRRGHDMGR